MFWGSKVKKKLTYLFTGYNLDSCHFLIGGRLHTANHDL